MNCQFHLPKELAPTLKVSEPIEKEQLADNTPKAAGVNTLKYVIPAKKAAPKAAIPKVILKASPRSAALPRAKESKPLELAMFGAAPFQYLTKQKGVEIFGISMRDLEYQLNKAKKPTTDPATVVPECYHEFLDVFSKKTLDKVSPH